ncbi:MAG: hypothetical protein V4850_03040 [Myxococcota bacterium]
MLTRVLAVLCGGDLALLDDFLLAFPTHAEFRPALAAFGTLEVLAGFLATRYLGDFARLRAELDKLGVGTLKRMVAGAGKRRASVAAAVDKARATIDRLLPAIAAAEPVVLVNARTARRALDARWALVSEFPTDRDLREVVVAIKTAQEAATLAGRGGADPVAPAAQAAWTGERRAARARVDDLRRRIVDARAKAGSDADLKPVTSALVPVIEGLKQLDAGGIDASYLAHVNTLIDKLSRKLGGLEAAHARKRERAEVLLEGPFDVLGDALPNGDVALREALRTAPVQVSDEDLTALETRLPALAGAYLFVEDLRVTLRVRLDALYGKAKAAQFLQQLAQLDAQCKDKDWVQLRRKLEALNHTVAAFETELAASAAATVAANAQAVALQAQRVREDADALAWGKVQFDRNPILAQVWAKTHLNRQQATENASIPGTHSWAAVKQAITVWEAAGAGSGVVSHVHVAGGRPQAKWEKDAARQVAQANFICTWRGVVVDIHVTVEIRSFLANGTWKREKLPDALKPYAPG